LAYSAQITEMEMEWWLQALDQWRDRTWKEVFPSIIDLIMGRVFLQRPHTDDMMQMCQDLGIDTPEFQPISYDGLTFTWRIDNDG
jgi:hypothetical protein